MSVIVVFLRPLGLRLEAAALTVFTALKAIDSLKVLFAPILSFSSEKLHGIFGYPAPLFGHQYTQSQQDDLGEHNTLRYRPVSSTAISWRPSQLTPGQPLNQPVPLFKKLEEKVADEERARMGK